MKSAETLQRAVVDELAWDPAIDSSAIAVTTRDGMVLLNGWVSSYAEKLAAEKAVRRVRGVTAVIDDLEVQILPIKAHDDSKLAEAALDALAWNVNVPLNAVRVTVDHGWIKLEGTVPWFFQRSAAENAIRFLKGVKGVTNLVVVHQKVNPLDIEERIEAAFKRHAVVDAEHVNVSVEHGRVTLRGKVSSWAERESAEEVAWSAPGVFSVTNAITVEVPAHIW